MTERSAFQHFVGELRRRHVPQTAAVYLVAAWAAIEFADVLVPNLNWPQWVVTAVIVAAAVGLPVVLVLAWIFDWGPEGIHRTGTPDATPAPGRPGVAPAATPPAARTGAPWIAAVAVLVVGIASAVIVAALVSGGAGDPGPQNPAADAPPMAPGTPGAAGDREGGTRAVPRRPELVAPGGEWQAQLESAMEELGRLGLDTPLDLRAIPSLVQAAVVITEPAVWRFGRGPLPLARGDSITVAGVARDSAGVVSVAVGGRVVARSDEPMPLLPFEAVVVGAGQPSQIVPVVVRTADGREIRRELHVIRAGR